MGLSPFNTFGLVSSLHIWLPHENSITVLVIPLVVIMIAMLLRPLHQHFRHYLNQSLL